MTRVFISYRRQDTGYIADNLSEKLQLRFGEDSVFYDIDTIPLGVDFREHIGEAVGKCHVLLVIIGDRWLRAADKQGNRRIDDPADYVRIEIESALKRDIPIVPVLVDDVVMPSPADLPESIQAIVFRNAAEIRAGRDMRQHIQRLIDGLEKVPQLRTAADGVAKKPSVVPKETNTSAKQSRRQAQPRPLRKIADQAVPRKSSQAVTVKDRKGTLIKEIRKALGRSNDETIFVGEEIPADKISNAIAAYARKVSRRDVLLLHDCTFFGGAKDGVLLTADAVYWRNNANDLGRIRYSDIKSVRQSGFINLTINERKIVCSAPKTLAKVISALRIFHSKGSKI